VLTGLLTDMLGMFGFSYIFELFLIFGWFSLIMTFVVFVSVVLPLYVLQSLALFRIAQKQGIDDAWMAWLPFCHSYLLGKIGLDGVIGVLMMGLNILTFSRVMPVLFTSVPFIVLNCVALHQTYKKMNGRSGWMSLLTVCSCGLLSPIFLFRIRNKALFVVHALKNSGLRDKFVGWGEQHNHAPASDEFVLVMAAETLALAELFEKEEVAQVEMKLTGDEERAQFALFKSMQTEVSQEDFVAFKQFEMFKQFQEFDKFRRLKKF